MQEHANKYEITGRLAQALRESQLSAADLAQRLGVTKSTVMAWERGDREPRSNRTLAIADILGVTPLWLLSGAGPMRPQPRLPEPEARFSQALVEVRRLQEELDRALTTLADASSDLHASAEVSGKDGAS